MLLSTLLWLPLWAACVQTHKGRTKTKNILRLRILEQPQGCKNTVDIYNFTVHTDQARRYLFDVDAIIHSPDKYLMWAKGSLKLDKCRGGISYNTCEYFGKWMWTADVCRWGAAPNMPWSPFVSGFNPKFSCPFKAGRYEMRNVTVDMDATARFLGPEMAGITWLTELQCFDDKGNLLQLSS